jgi:hypothetical protein
MNLTAGRVVEVEETEQHIRRRVLDHVGPAPLDPHKQPVRGQRVDRLAGRPLADAELRGDLELIGDDLAGAPFSCPYPVEESLARLGVERAKARV